MNSIIIVVSFTFLKLKDLYFASKAKYLNIGSILSIRNVFYFSRMCAKISKMNIFEIYYAENFD